METKKSGVYIITCKMNRKVYIGSSGNIKQRHGEHRSELRHMKHFNNDLQDDYNFYGESMFSYDYLEYCDDKSKLEELEDKWVQLYKALDPEFGYNKLKVKRYDIDIVVLTERRRGRAITFINDYTGEVRQFDNIAKGCKIVGLPERTVRDMIMYWTRTKEQKSIVRSLHGWLAVSTDVYDPSFNYREYVKPKKQRYDQVPRPKRLKAFIPMEERDLCRKEVRMIHIDTGREFVYRSVADCIREERFKANKVYAILRGAGYSHRGYRFEYTGKDKVSTLSSL